MRTINSDKGQQVFSAAVKLVHDFGELGRALLAFFRPNKVKRTGLVINNQTINPADLNHPIENYCAPTPISKMMELWHEMAEWDLLKNQSRPKKP